jgi:hypothetical protein
MSAVVSPTLRKQAYQIIATVMNESLRWRSEQDFRAADE